MRKLALSDVKNLHEHELIRDDWRREVIAEKARRRLALGARMSLVFENRLTVLNQVQEMCRSERIVKPEAVQAEIDVYNELIPDAGEVSATLFVEITTEGDVRSELDRLIGLTSGSHLWMELNGRKVYAAFDQTGSRADRIAAVQYLRFPIGADPSDRAALESGEAPVRICVDHPGYRAAVDLPGELRRELARDLQAD